MKEELRNFLLEQGVWERELDEVENAFNDQVTREDLVIVRIYDTSYELGQSYIENVVGELDHHIRAVLDPSMLGIQIAKSCDEYLRLSCSGRIIQFEL